jgi:hypothetical protein
MALHVRVVIGDVCTMSSTEDTQRGVPSGLIQYCLVGLSAIPAVGLRFRRLALLVGHLRAFSTERRL